MDDLYHCNLRVKIEPIESYYPVCLTNPPTSDQYPILRSLLSGPLNEPEASQDAYDSIRTITPILANLKPDKESIKSGETDKIHSKGPHSCDESEKYFSISEFCCRPGPKSSKCYLCRKGAEKETSSSLMDFETSRDVLSVETQQIARVSKLPKQHSRRSQRSLNKM